MSLRFWNHAPVWGAVLAGATWLGFPETPAQAQVEQAGGHRFGWHQPVPYVPCPPPAPPWVAPSPAVQQPPAQPPGQAQPPQTPAQPQVPPAPTEPSLGFEQFAALGAETVALSDSGVGYIDPAIPRTQFRLRYDAAYNNNRPDRAEMFYAKCGCFRRNRMDPDAEGPPSGPPLPAPQMDNRIERSVDYQDISSYFEVAANQRLSGFVEIPVRFFNGEVLDNTVGMGDMNAGFKYALVACRDQFVTFQLRTYIPTGDSDVGLGNHHVSLEPALLVYQRLSDRLVFEGELRDWIPLGGSDFAGNIIRYGAGFTYDAYRSGNLRIAPVTELVGWTVLGGKELAVAGLSSAAQDADGDTILNAKLGVRTYLDNSSLYIGYGRALTGDVWYKDIFRVEYRLAF